MSNVKLKRIISFCIHYKPHCKEILSQKWYKASQIHWIFKVKKYISQVTPCEIIPIRNGNKTCILYKLQKHGSVYQNIQSSHSLIRSSISPLLSCEPTHARSAPFPCDEIKTGLAFISTVCVYMCLCFSFPPPFPCSPAISCKLAGH